MLLLKIIVRIHSFSFSSSFPPSSSSIVLLCYCVFLPSWISHLGRYGCLNSLFELSITPLCLLILNASSVFLQSSLCCPSQKYSKHSSCNLPPGSHHVCPLHVSRAFPPSPASYSLPSAPAPSKNNSSPPPRNTLLKPLCIHLPHKLYHTLLPFSNNFFPLPHSAIRKSDGLEHSSKMTHKC